MARPFVARPFVARPLAHLGVPDAQLRAFPSGLGDRSGIERPDAPCEHNSILAPVEERLRLRNLLRVGDAGLGLRHFDRRAKRQRIDGLTHELRAEPGQPIGKASRRIGRSDIDRAAREQGPGVEPLFHAHDCDTGDLIPRQDGALNRRGSAPARQERGVDIEAAEAGGAERGGRQDQAIGHHDQGIQLQIMQRAVRPFGSEGRRLVDGKPQL